jgi:hypothetical protein
VKRQRDDNGEARATEKWAHVAASRVVVLSTHLGNLRGSDFCHLGPSDIFKSSRLGRATRPGCGTRAAGASDFDGGRGHSPIILTWRLMARITMDEVDTSCNVRSVSSVVTCLAIDGGRLSRGKEHELGVHVESIVASLQWTQDRQHTNIALSLA